MGWSLRAHPPIPAPLPLSKQHEVNQPPEKRWLLLLSAEHAPSPILEARWTIDLMSPFSPKSGRREMIAMRGSEHVMGKERQTVKTS